MSLSFVALLFKVSWKSAAPRTVAVNSCLGVQPICSAILILIVWCRKGTKCCITSFNLADPTVPNKCILLINFNIRRALQVHLECTPSEEVKVSFKSSSCAQSMNSESINAMPLLDSLSSRQVLNTFFSTNTRFSCSTYKAQMTRSREFIWSQFINSRH